jgi:hypothetical protein
MNPVLNKISDDGDVTKFTLSGINVSLANAIRRTILSDIPITCFYTETNKDNSLLKLLHYIYTSIELNINFEKLPGIELVYPIDVDILYNRQ